MTKAQNLREQVEAQIEELLEELRTLPFEYDDEIYALWQSIQAQLNNFYDIRNRFLKTREDPAESFPDVLY